MSMTREVVIFSGGRGRTASRWGTYVFVPLWDLNPLEKVRFQYVTVGIILINCLVYFALQLGLVYPVPDAAQGFGLIPHDLVSTFTNQPVATAPTAVPLPQRFTLITYMFLHGSFMHLFGNMIFLWVFGDNVEDAMGHVRFLCFYLLCGIFAGLTHVLMATDQNMPMIGASGAVSGVIAAYLILHPRVRVWCLWFFRIPLRVSAGFALLVWIGLQVVSIAMHADDGVAWWAHIGGLISGAVLVLFMRRPGIPLFDRSTGLEPRSTGPASQQEA
jgi:membrane associated rhomboid family serine protease